VPAALEEEYFSNVAALFRGVLLLFPEPKRALLFLIKVASYFTFFACALEGLAETEFDRGKMLLLLFELPFGVSVNVGSIVD